MVLFFDVDGTIYDSDLGLSESFARAFPLLRAMGHTLCLNTGRTKMIIPDSVLALGFDAIVAGSGSYVEYKGKVIYENYIPDEIIKKALKAFEGFAFCVETYDFVYMSRHFAALRLSEMGKNVDSHSQLKHVEPNKFQFRNSMGEYPLGKKVNKISFLADDVQRKVIHDILGESCTILEEKNPVFGLHYGEAVAKGCSKASGGQKLMDSVGGGAAAAFGDGMNDADMLRWADISVAMGNATPAIKAMADYVCGDCMGDGVWTVMDKLKPM